MRSSSCSRFSRFWRYGDFCGDPDYKTSENLSKAEYQKNPYPIEPTNKNDCYQWVANPSASDYKSDALSTEPRQRSQFDSNDVRRLWQSQLFRTSAGFESVAPALIPTLRSASDEAAMIRVARRVPLVE